MVMTINGSRGYFEHWLYIAGSYRAATRAEVQRNIEAARRRALDVIDRGWYPATPHLLTAHFDHYRPLIDDQYWLQNAINLMRCCGGVCLVDEYHNSAGTLAEISAAKKIGMPVFYTLDELPRFEDYEVMQ